MADNIFDQLAAQPRQAQAAPQPSTGGGNIFDQLAAQQQASNQPSQDNGVLSDAGAGAVAGAEDTVTGLSRIGLKIPGMSGLSQMAGDATATVADKLGHHDFATSMRGLSTDQGQYAAEAESQSDKDKALQTNAGKVGYGGETLLEFMMGDEALKSLSWADKMAAVSKAAKILETSPRLMGALKAGANLAKANATLGPAEIKMLKDSPVLARLVNSGIEAMRAGVVQGVQTGVKTGDWEQAGKEGLEMAGGSAVIGGVLGTGAGILAKGKDAGEGMAKAGASAEAGVDKISQIAANAPDKADIADQAANMVNKAQKKMHDSFADDLNAKVKGPLQDHEIPLEGSPLQKAAQSVLDLPENADALSKLSSDTTPVSNEAKTYIKGIANALKPPAEQEGDEAVVTGFAGKAPDATPPPEGEEYQLDINKLIQQRQTIGARARDAWKSGSYGDAKAYSTVIDGIDDTIGQLADQTGNPDVAKDYQDIRNSYKNSKGLFEDKDARSMIQNIMRGNLADVTNKLISGQHGTHAWETIQKIIDDPVQIGKLQNSMYQDLVKEGPEKILGYDPNKINRLRDLVGDSNMKALGEHAIQPLLDSATRDGMLDAEKALELLSKQKPEKISALYPTKQLAQNYAAMYDEISKMASAKALVKAGVLYPVTMAVGAGAEAAIGRYVAGSIGQVIGILSGGGTAAVPVIRQFIDNLAMKPWLWKTIGSASEAAGSKTAGVLGTAVKAGATKAAIHGTATFEGAKTALSGN